MTIKELAFYLNIARYVQNSIEKETIAVEKYLKTCKQKLSDFEKVEYKLVALLTEGKLLNEMYKKL